MAKAEVTFGANIGQLVEGVGKVRESVDSLKEHFDAVLGAVGADLSFEGIKSFIESMTELGEQTQLTGATLGVSNQSVIALSGYAALGGQSLDTMATAIERMTLNIQHATRDGVNPQAQALRVLGLNARDLIGLPTDQYFIKLADAVSKFNPSLNLSNALMEVGGRQATALLPILLQGADKMREFQSEWTAASEGLAAAVPGMDETHEKLLLLGEAARSFGARIFTALKPAIDAVIDGIRGWMESMRQGDIQAVVRTIGDYTLAALKAVGDTVIAIVQWIDRLAQKTSFLKELAANTGKYALAGAGIGAAMSPEALGAGAIPGAFVGGAVGFGTTLLFGGDNSPANQSEDERRKFDATIAQWRSSFDAAEATIGTGAEKVVAGVHRLNAGAINMAAPQELMASINAINAQVQAQQQSYQQQVTRINELANSFRITEAQKTQMLLAAVAQRESAQESELQHGMRLHGLNAEQYRRFQDELTKIQHQAALDREKINAQALQAYQKEWTSALQSIESSFNANLRGLLAGTTSWSETWRKMLGDMIIKWIEMVEQMVVKWLAGQLAMTTATQTGVATRTAAEQAGTASSALSAVANALKTIAADAAQVFGGVFAFLAPTLGPAAAAPAAAAQASVLGAAVFDLGTDYVVRGGLALIHPGETIVPAARGSGPFSGASLGPTVHAPVNVNLSALDAQSVRRFFNDNSHHLLRAINDAVKRGAHLGMRAARV